MSIHMNDPKIQRCEICQRPSMFLEAWECGFVCTSCRMELKNLADWEATNKESKK